MEKIFIALLLISTSALATNPPGGGNPPNSGGNPPITPPSGGFTPPPNGGANFPGSSGGFGPPNGGGIPRPPGGGIGGTPPPGTPPIVPPPRPIPITGVPRVNAVARANANVRNIVNVNGVPGGGGGGGVNIRYPQQAPGVAISGYGSFSPSSCLGSVGLGGSGPGASGTLLFPYESDPCNTRQNSAQMDAYGYHKTACQIMRDEFDEVDDAMKKTGESCDNPGSRFASMPYPGAVVNPAPVADVPDDVVRRPELNNKLDNAQRLGVLK